MNELSEKDKAEIGMTIDELRSARRAAEYISGDAPPRHRAILITKIDEAIAWAIALESGRMSR